MPSFSPTKPPPWLQAVLIMLVTWAGVAAIFGRAGWADWTRAYWLEGDPLEVYARVRIAAEQPLHSLFNFTRIERLGAPVAADWSGYPVPDRLVFVLTGLLSRVTGLIAAVHLAGAMIAALNATSFYLAARWLRFRWEWATALAIVFSLSSYTLRWGITLSFSQVFVLPPLVLLCARATRPGPPAGSRRAWLILAAVLGVWLGLANPYLAYFAGIVAGGTLLLGLALRRPRARWLPLLVFCTCLTGSFVLGNARAIAAHAQHSVIQNRGQTASDLRTFALRPADWVVPPADHRIPALGALGRSYQSALQGRGEFSYNYLGLAGLAGIAVLFWQRLWRRHWTRPDPVIGLGWITLFGIAGGLNTWLGAAGLDVFRASTRIGIYALVWALFALGTWLSRRSRGWPRPASVALAMLLGLAAVWEQTPFLADRAAPARNDARWQATAKLTGWLEQELPAYSPRVFQLPVVTFPEAGSTGAMPDYEHFLPLLTSGSLHFSYGQLHHSPWLRWARYLAKQPEAKMIAALEQSGHAALWLDRRAYADGGDSLAGRLHAHGVAELPLPAAGLPIRIFRLNPAVLPTLPDPRDPRYSETWDPSASDPNALLALDGWYPLEQAAGRQWRWVQRRAHLGLWREGHPEAGTLRFRIDGPAGSVVVLRRADQDLWRGSPGPQVQEIRLPVNTGLTLLRWELTGPTFRPGGDDPRELGFMVENLSLSVP